MRYLILTLCCLSLLAQASSLLMPGHFFYLSLENSFVKRTGFENAGGKELVIPEDNLSTLDFNVGWFKHLYGDKLALRLYGTTGAGESGIRLPDRLLNDLKFHDLREKDTHSFYSVVSELVFYRPASRFLYPYVFGGAGYNSYTVSSTTTVEDTSTANGAQVDQSSEKTSCISLDAGIGFQFFMSYYFGFFAQYKFRYWSPIAFESMMADVTFKNRETQTCDIIEIGSVFKF